jgi:hypothetical protein
MRRLSSYKFLALLASFWLLVGCGDEGTPEPPPTISAPTVSGIFQPDGQLTINFTITGNFKEGNVFTAQLSDGTGNFSNPTTIGALNSLAAGTINAMLPASVANGTAYRIRVAASTPTTTSPDNGSNLSIVAPAITISSFATSPGVNQTYIAGREVTLTISTTGTFAADNQFTVEISNTAGTFGGLLGSVTASTLTSRTVTLPAGIPAGTGFRFRITSTKPAINSAFSNTFEIVTPSITGFNFGANPNFVAGGLVTASFFETNGPWLTNNEFNLELSDVSGSFTNPVRITYSSTTQASIKSLLFNIPTTTPAGAGYRMRLVSTNPVVVGTPTSPFAIGALPTISLAVGTPAFTKLYSGQTYTMTYTMNVTKTSTFNSGTSFTIQMSNNDQTFANGPTTVATLSTAQVTELQNTGSTVVTMGFRDLLNGTRRFRVNTNGHGNVVSNELQMNVTQGSLTTMGANIDAQTIGFGTNLGFFSSNLPGTRNNQELLLAADEPTTVFGAVTIRLFIGIPLVNENVSTGTQTGRLIVHYLNAAGEQIAVYNNTSVTMSISGSPTAYSLSANGPYTLNRTSAGNVGNTTISLQSVSASFRVQ